ARPRRPATARERAAGSPPVAFAPPPVERAPREANAVSSWWWAIAVIFAFVGGVVAYFANREADPKTARNMLIVGIVMTFVWPVLLSGA
ncbi:MAG: hypothetical protein O3B31_08090, partial [Chloroflexi bacterium]|nr:hypothetical protein [Chloroflexota bacterium]